VSEALRDAGNEPSLPEFLAPGIVANDLPALFPLLAARPLLAAFTALFHGGEDGVLARLLVLREIGRRGASPYWSPHELESHFAYLDPVKLLTILNRLKEHALLCWDGDRRQYAVSAAGRMALAAIEQLLQFSAEDDADLGFLNAQIAGGAALGRVPAELLWHLLARLTELEEEFGKAVQSGSEFQLRRAQDHLASVWQWMEKGTEVMRGLNDSGLLDDASWRIAQEIGSRQARIMRMTGVFQRELSAITRQRVHLSQSGLTSSELGLWLRERNAGELAGLADGVLADAPETAFALGDVMADIAEFELIVRLREERVHSVMPERQDEAMTETIATELPRELPRLVTLLRTLAAPTDVIDVVVGNDYSAAAYRYSLLPLIGETTVDPELAPFAALRVRLEFDSGGAMRSVGRDEVAAIDAARLVPYANPARVADASAVETGGEIGAHG
jgi:hypothetical protein